jgi:hypothetical protein
MVLISGAVTIILSLVCLLQIKCGRIQDCKYILVLYIINHVSAVVLVYTDLLPDVLTGPKEIFEYQIIINYVFINLLPMYEFHFSMIYQVPFVLIGAYFQAKGEY